MTQQNYCLASVILCAMLALGCGDRDPQAFGDDAGVADLKLAEDARRDGALLPDAGPTPHDDGKVPDGPMLTDGAPAPDGPAPTTPFTLVLMPDTQYYSQKSSLFHHYTAQTKWIVNNQATKRIAFVSHVGDIVHNNASGSTKNKDQWDRADQAMKLLDGDLKKQPNGQVPYGAVVGNHDYDVYLSKSSALQYISYFGPARYQGRSWFLGASPNKENMAQLFVANGQKYLHLALEWRPEDRAIAWAQQQLRKHPTVPAIVATHHFLGKGNPASRSTSGDTADTSGDNSPESLYRKLVEPFPQVFLVLCGHVGGNGQRLSTSALGQQVHQILVDYQFDTNGGNGFMQLLEFQPATKKILSRAFSPTFKAGVTAGTDRAKVAASNYSLTFDLQAHRQLLSATKIRRFRQGQDFGAGAYNGTLDTYIGDGKEGTTKPGVSNGAAVDVWCDGNQDHEQALIRFDKIIGGGAGQVPAGTKIKKATLTLTTEGAYADSKGGARFHRMKVTWSEASTWNSLSGGVTPGVEAETKHDADSAGKVSSKGTRSFDVTASVQAWLNGAANKGWVLINKSTDRWTWRSSEWSEVVERPLLTVLY